MGQMVTGPAFFSGRVWNSGNSTGHTTCLEADDNVIVVVGIAALEPRFVESLKAAGFELVRARETDDLQHFTTKSGLVAIFVGAAQGVDPYAVVRLLRHQERLAFVQLVVFSVDGERLRLSQALLAGADDIVNCPLEEPDEAVDCIVARVARCQSLARLVVLDPLTGLHNRRLMNDQLSVEIARARRMGTKLALAILDLDNFKRTNDVFGHAIGDRTLVAFSQVLRRSLRNYDMIYRFGGDEFVVLFPGCDVNGALAALAQIRLHSGATNSVLPTVTFSAGIAEFPGDGDAWKDLFEVADRNLRRAKDDAYNRDHPKPLG